MEENNNETTVSLDETAEDVGAWIEHHKGQADYCRRQERDSLGLDMFEIAREYARRAEIYEGTAAYLSSLPGDGLREENERLKKALGVIREQAEEDRAYALEEMCCEALRGEMPTIDLFVGKRPEGAPSV